MLNRRDAMVRLGQVGAGALALPGFLQTLNASQPRAAGRAKSCILLYLWGGPPQQDMWDMKPDAPEEVRGEFLLTEQNQESQNLTADFGLLRKLSENTGGKFYKLATINKLAKDLSSAEAKSLIHSEESFHPLINLKAVFFILLALISLEWFLRKYFGAY